MCFNMYNLAVRRVKNNILRTFKAHMIGSPIFILCNRFKTRHVLKVFIANILLSYILLIKPNL